MPRWEEDHMSARTTSDVGRPTSLTEQRRWSRMVESLCFGAAHVDNVCALTWYATHVSSAGRSHRRAEPLDLAGPDATRTRGKGTPMRRTPPTEGDRA